MDGKRVEDKKPFFTKKRLLKGVLALCVTLVIASLGYIGFYIYEYVVEINIQKSVHKEFKPLDYNLLPSPSDGALPSYQPGQSPDPSSEAPVMTEREYLLYLEGIGRELNATLLERNPDFRGTVSIPGLIETPMPYVHTDSNDTYLHRNFDGAYSDSGTIFLSAYNDPLLLDRNNVLFGHHMKNGTMFTPITKYKYAETYEKAPVIVLESLTGKTVWVVFAGYTCEPDYGYINTKLSRDAFSDLLDEIRERSIFDTDIDVTPDDRILTLSTCDYDYADMRFALHARLLRDGEEIPESVAAVKNPDRQPYNIPNEMKLSEVEAHNTAALQHPNSLKIYYYQAFDGGINWLVSSTYGNVQGVYTNFTGKASQSSNLAAIHNTVDQKTYIALDQFSGQLGIFLLANRLPYGDMRLVANTAVTPPGEDAKYPLLTFNGTDMHLIYTVSRTDGDYIYRSLIVSGAPSGEPELLTVAPAGCGARAAGCYETGGNTLLIWHETVNKTVRGTWVGYSETFDVSVLSGDAERVTLYGTLNSGNILSFSVNGGKINPATVSLSGIPAPVPYPEPEPEDLLPAEGEQIDPAEPIDPVSPVDPVDPALPTDSAEEPSDPGGETAPNNESTPEST